MIKPKCFTPNWIQQKRRNAGNVDAGLLEKTIYAFDLLGRVVNNKLNFVFKGGTSLLLLLENFRRLSIDVDVLCDSNPESLKPIFDRTIKDSNFTEWKEDPRTASEIPKKHFKFYFNSVVNNRADYILLDILYGSNIFPETQSKPIDLELFECDIPVKVKVPTINGIIGDKLTAFAPNTVGIPYQVNDQVKSMQIIKQLFDLGELFSFASNLQEITASYQAFLAAENGYRKKNYTADQTLDDTIETCYLISQLRLRKSKENEQTEILRRGIQQIQSHLINRPFRLNDAKLAAAKTVLMAQMLRTNSTPTTLPIRFENDKLDEISEENLSGKFVILNRLKAILPEAFYYWLLFSRLAKTKST